MNHDDRELGNWPEFLAYMESKKVALTIAGARRVAFTLPSKRQLETFVAWHQTMPTGAVWLGLAVSLGEYSLFRMRAALVANKRLPVGAFGLLQEVMLLTQSLPLRRLRASLLDQTFSAMTSTVDMLASASSPDRSDDEPFAYVFTKRMVTP